MPDISLSCSKLQESLNRVCDQTAPEDSRRKAALDLAFNLLEWEHEEQELSASQESLRHAKWKKLAEKLVAPRLESRLKNLPKGMDNFKTEVEDWIAKYPIKLLQIATLEEEMQKIQAEVKEQEAELAAQGLKHDDLQAQKRALNSRLEEMRKAILLHAQVQEEVKNLDTADAALGTGLGERLRNVLKTLDNQYVAWHREDAEILASMRQLQEEAGRTVMLDEVKNAREEADKKLKILINEQDTKDRPSQGGFPEQHWKE
jgi:chromosome segregation ATPase